MRDQDLLLRVESLEKQVADMKSIRHSQPRVVGREEIIKILSKESIADSDSLSIVAPYGRWSDTFIGDLLALLNGEGRKAEKIWCEHFEYVLCGMKMRWCYRTDGGTEKEAHLYIRDEWDICPVAGCHAPRPKED